METKNWLSLKELGEQLEPKMKEKETLHQADGKFDAEDVKVYVDMYRKSVTKHQGSEIVSGRITVQQLVEKANEYFGKALKLDRLDAYNEYPTVYLKEVR